MLTPGSISLIPGVSAPPRRDHKEEGMIVALYIAAAVIMAAGSLYLTWRSVDFSQISSRRVPRVIGHFVLSLSRRCFGASTGDKFCRNTSDQRSALHRPFRTLPALFLFWLHQEAKG